MMSGFPRPANGDRPAKAPLERGDNRDGLSPVTADHPFDLVIGRVRERGGIVRHVSTDQVRATCPAHPDRKPSLAVKRIERGVLVHCHAGCAESKLLRALGLRSADLFTGPRTVRERSEVVATYDYFDRAGVLVARKKRSALKAFWWERPDPTARGGWRAGLSDAGLPGLYRRAELTGAPLTCLVEGEKAVERLRQLGLTGTCGPAGASTWSSGWSVDLLEAISGVVAILPDNDPAGFRHAERVAADIAAVHAHQGGSAIEIKVVSLPALPPGGDVVDWLEANGGREALLELIMSTPLWSPEAAERQRARRRSEKAKERMRKHRAIKRGVDTSSSASSRGATDGDADALGALVMLLQADEPRSGRACWRALKGGAHSRSTISRALASGVEKGDLIRDRGPRGAHIYRLSDIHCVTDPGQSRSSVPVNGAATEPTLAGFPQEIAVSHRPVTPFAVTPGERSSRTLQDSLSRTRPTGVTGAGTLAKAEPTNVTGNGTVGSMLSDEPATDPPARNPIGAGTSRALPDEQQQAIAAGRCCGKDGAELRCQLCQWSPTYLPLLRKSRETLHDNTSRCSIRKWRPG